MSTRFSTGNVRRPVLAKVYVFAYRSVRGQVRYQAANDIAAAMVRD